MPRPNWRPKRVASSAEATGPRWSNASQKLTPATWAPCRVSATQPPASTGTADSASTWLARWRSRSAHQPSRLAGDGGDAGLVDGHPVDDAADQRSSPAK